MTDKPIDPNVFETVDTAEDVQFLTYRDLEARRVLGSRTHLMRLQRNAGFPLPMRIGGKAVWPVSLIRAWLLANVVPGRPAIFAAGDSKATRKRSITNP